ncbi:hypothetical protein [Leeuwenhoekiella aestuarii]|uniref:hypothetical protein n=1 Tax=Leeuwenhoekiella aestuarii TaxID=2249426 RepID=UPI000FFE6C3A|nr:hypothetical protein [Leeuwenhoekiella aestuarii]
MEAQSQQLTVSQHKLSDRIAKAGNLTEIAFARNVVEFDKIKNIPPDQIGPNLAMVFVKAANLIGLKDPISNINKQDIKEMILARFKSLSIEEIDYAFKLERYGVYGERVKHFQLFNAEYVSKVLDQYKKWLLKIRHDNNIPLFKDNSCKTDELTEDQKMDLILNGLREAHAQFIETNSIEPGRLYLYDFLDEYGIMPKDINIKNKVKEMAERRLVKRQKAALNKIEKALYELKKDGKPSNKVVVACKEISLERLFTEYKNVEQIISKIKINN